MRAGAAMIVRRQGNAQDFELIGRYGVRIGLDARQVARLREVDLQTVRRLEGDPALAPVAGAVRYLLDAEPAAAEALQELHASIPTA